MLDLSAERRFGPFQVGDYREFQGRRSRSSAGPERRSRSRPARSRFSITGWRSRSRPTSFRGRTTFILVRLEPGADAAAVRREICRRLPYNDVYSQREWARRSRGYWIESTGLGLTLVPDCRAGRLGRRGHRGADALCSTTEHLTEFGTVKAIGGGNLTIYGDHRRAGVVCGGSGFRRRAGDRLRSRARCWHRLDMRMIVSPTLAAWSSSARRCCAWGLRFCRSGRSPRSTRRWSSEVESSLREERLSRGGARGSRCDEDLPRGHARVPVLRGVSLSVERGEVVAIVGPIGLGKDDAAVHPGVPARPTSAAS